MTAHSESIHQVILYTSERKPLLEGSLLSIVEQGFKNLPRRFPGLKILGHSIHPDRVEMSLDLQRLDEDLPRILQSFKSEVKNLAKKDGFASHNLWQWTYEEK